MYVDTGRVLARRYKYVHIQQLLRCVGETGQVDDKCYDDIILACVRIVSADQSQVYYLKLRLIKPDLGNSAIFCLRFCSLFILFVGLDRAQKENRH